MKEYKIDTEFNLSDTNRNYYVKKVSDNGGCFYCSFFGINLCKNTDLHGECCKDKRSDNTDVYFVEKSIQQDNKRKTDSYEDYKNLKPYDLNKIHLYPDSDLPISVCTRDGRNARIICVDKESVIKTEDSLKKINKIVALVQDWKDITFEEKIVEYFENGKLYENENSALDLMIKPIQKSGFIAILSKDKDQRELENRVYSNLVYPNKDELIKSIKNDNFFINADAIINVTWEE